MNEAVKEDVQVPEGRDYEAEARKQGWAPLDDWKGDPKDFKSAEQFVKDGEQIPAIMKSKIEKLEGRVEQLLESNKRFNEFSQRSLEKEKKEKQKVIQELEQLRKQAITDGDGEAFDRADKQLSDLKSEEIDTNGIDPLAKNWLENNSWYETNVKLAAYADGIADRLVAQGYTGRAYFEQLTKNVKEAFPDEFGNKRRSQPNTVEAGTEAVTGSERTFSDLPKEAKDAFKQFQRDIPGLTKEQYVEQYDWDE
jgi:hypothetical protein